MMASFLDTPIFVMMSFENCRIHAAAIPLVPKNIPNMFATQHYKALAAWFYSGGQYEYAAERLSEPFYSTELMLIQHHFCWEASNCFFGPFHFSPKSVGSPY